MYGMKDKAIEKLIQAEAKRQFEGLEMIPSENHTSTDVLKALGSRLTDKYSEGYPGKRYYGGHMTHGLKVNFSGTLYHSVQYHTGKDGYLDYDEMAGMVTKQKPKLIFVGATAYPRIFDWKKLRDIANLNKAWLVADISHIAGLVVGGVHPSPVGFADVITTTTHKTLRGPRGAMILCNGNPSSPLKAVERKPENLPTLIDRAIIPGLQGGPHNHQTAAIAVALREA